MRFEPKSLPNRSLAVRDQGYIYAAIAPRSHIRPYYPDSTVSRPICEVKQGQVRLVLAWGTSWEVRMLYIFGLFAVLPACFSVFVCFPASQLTAAQAHESH